MTPDLSGAIDHIHVYVSSRRAAAAWYGENLGFSVLEKFAFWATDEGGPLTLTDASGAIHFALFKSAQAKPVSLAFGASASEYAAWKEHLNSIGIQFREADHQLCHSIYFDDPFGNQLEITTYDVN